MKALSVIAQDLRDLAQMNVEMADELDRLAEFFGGSSAKTAQPKAARVERTPVETKKSSRKLNADEKAAIKVDWEAADPERRTGANQAAMRRTLAAKHRCSVQQVFGITRQDNALLKRALERATR